MVSIQVKKSRIAGSVRCPSSKSYTHRALAIASLAPGQSTIANALLARDTLATLACCRALGAEIESKREGRAVQVQGRQGFEPPENVLNCENSGTTIRIMTALSGIGESLAPSSFMSETKSGYETSTDSAPATIDLSVSIAAIVNAIKSRWSL